MVEMHLLSVSDSFVYDPIYALGIVTTYDTFMEGYRPEEDISNLFTALCLAVESTPEQYRNDAQLALSAAEGVSLDDLKSTLGQIDAAGAEGLSGMLKGVAERDRFKYSRAFGIGFYTLVQNIAPDLAEDKEQVMGFMKEAAESLSISFDKLQKDIELYRSNLEKMGQAKALMAEVLEAERKKREERAQAKLAKDQPAEKTTEGEATTEDEATPPIPTPAGEGEDSTDQS